MNQWSSVWGDGEEWAAWASAAGPVNTEPEVQAQAEAAPKPEPEVQAQAEPAPKPASVSWLEGGGEREILMVYP